jgi:hypothetical protein
MPNYEVTISNTYRVTADSPEQALGSWRVRFDGVAMVSVGLGPDQVLSQDDFEFLDGKGEAVEV